MADYKEEITGAGDEAFRDSIGTIDESGKRRWIYPKKPNGPLYRYRSLVSYVLLALLFAMPFIKVNGLQLLQFNILERKIDIFGMTFMPQDFYLFVLAMLVGVLFVVLFTVVYGRVFCGWVCPQTIFMEMVFRKIEYFIEGDYTQQKRLNAAPWNAEKIRKKTLKHIIFYAIAFLIGNTFLAYIIGSDKLIQIISEPPSQHLAGLAGIAFFSLVFYFVFAFFREQVCIAVCPYGRLQGVMLDKDSIVVAYDHVRGEPRGRIQKKRKQAIDLQNMAVAEESQLGDCIDCSLCVKVCPTGIDIRNGTQLECVNCTACIDACNEVMEKVGRPKGLIRYASLNGIEEQKPFTITPRIAAYTAVLAVLVSVLGFFLFSRSDYETTILRVRGSLYSQVDENTISNMYDVHVVNKTVDSVTVNFKLISPEGGSMKMIGQQELNIPAREMGVGNLMVMLPNDKLTGHKTKVVIGVYSRGSEVDRVKTGFIGPITFDE